MSTTIHKQILIGALALFGDDQDKWIKGHLWNHDKTSFCVVGAIEVYTRKLGIDVRAPAVAAAYTSIRKLAQARGYHTTTLFNDAPSTTFANIKALLREAIQTVDA